MAEAPVIVWFRNDLRLADHAALRAALQTGRPVLPVVASFDVTDPGVKIEPLGQLARQVSGACGR